MPSSRKPILPFFGYAALFLAVLAIAGHALHPLIRRHVTYDLGMMDAKLNFYDSHKDDYQILFIGSSLTLRQVDTPALGKALAAKGCKARAYNLGIAAAKLEEMDYMLDHVLASPSENLRLIVIARPFSAPARPGGVSDRARYFSDDAGTRARLTNIRQDVYDGPKLWARYAVALSFYGYEHLNVGLLSRIAFPQAFAASADDLGELSPVNQWALEQNDGFISLDQELREDDKLQQRVADFGYKAKNFAEKLEKGKKPLSDTDKNMPEARRRGALLADMALDARAKGINAGALIFPTPSAGYRFDYNMAEGFKEKAPDLPVFSVADPARYPQFWQDDKWFDQGHMNESAAKEIAQILADQMAPHICGGGE